MRGRGRRRIREDKHSGTWLTARANLDALRGGPGRAARVREPCEGESLCSMIAEICITKEFSYIAERGKGKTCPMRDLILKFVD